MKESNSPVRIVMLLDNSFVSDARVEKEISALKKVNAQITVICTKDESLKVQEQRNGYTIRRLIDKGFNAPLRKTYSAFIEQTTELVLSYEFDVLHCHDFYMLSIGVEVKKQRPSIHLIYDAHEYLKGWPFYKSAQGLNKWKGKVVWNALVRKEKKEIQFADTVLTITEPIAERLKSNNSLNALPAVVGNHPNAIDVTRQKKYFQQKYALETSTKILIHTGTIYHTNEQLELLYDVVKETQDVALVFVGNRPRFFEIQEVIAKRNDLNSRIFFHEYPSSQSEVIQLLANADIGLLHIIDSWEAHRIGFSNRFVEYIMSGIPVIATPQTFTHVLNEKYNCARFYKGNNIDELKQALHAVLDQLEEFRRNADKAKENLNWEKESQKLIDLYATFTK